MKLLADGTPIEGVAGERLLDAAQRAGLPLEGTCGGDMACATCHVVVDPADAGRIDPASEEEKPWCCDSLVMREPIVSMIFHPPVIVPSAIAT